MTSTNRETWLNDLAKLMAPKFEALGHSLPPFRVSIGFTSGGKSSKAGAEVWHKNNSADGKFEIFINPGEAKPLQIAAYLGHELNHTAVGFKAGHKGEFAAMMAKLGFQRPFTASVAGAEFEAWVTPFLEQLGPLPHAALKLRSDIVRGDAGDSEDGEGDDDNERGGSSNDKKKQSTRQLKAVCKECAYTVRLSRKWADSLGAVCPEHGRMDIEIPAGAVEDPADD